MRIWYPSHSVYTCACLCGVVASGLLWSSPCLISMSIDSICFAHERVRMCRRTGERKNAGCGGRVGTVVYLSPPYKNLYHTLRALIKDHTVVCTLSLQEHTQLKSCTHMDQQIHIHVIIIRNIWCSVIYFFLNFFGKCCFSKWNVHRLWGEFVACVERATSVA